MNVYLIEDEGGGVTMFDAGIKAMSTGHRRGRRRRSAASTASCSATPTPTTAARRRRFGVPTYCHPADRIDAEGDGGVHYFDYSKVSLPGRWTLPRLLPVWDGGPVAIAGTVTRATTSPASASCTSPATRRA